MKTVSAMIGNTLFVGDESGLIALAKHWHQEIEILKDREEDEAEITSKAKESGELRSCAHAPS